MTRYTISQGVSEERLARALQVDIKNIQDKCALLHNICPEAVRMLEKTTISGISLRQLKKVTAERQVEIAETMNYANNYSVSFCRGLLLATRKEQLVGCHQKKVNSAIDYVALVKMQDELENLQHEMQLYEDSYGQNFLNLVVARGYLAKLLGNERVNIFLQQHYSEIATAIKHIVDSVSLEG